MKDDRPSRRLARDLVILLLGVLLAILLLGALAGGCCMTPGIGPL